MAHPNVSSSHVHFRPESKAAAFRIFVPLFLLSSALLILGLKFNASRTLFNYLLAFTFLMSLGLGGLFFSMLQHATGAGWSVVVRRIPESLSHFLPWGFLLILPIVFGLDFLYEWSRHKLHDPILSHKAMYLNEPFFILRNILYFSIWTLLYKKIIRASIAQDHHGALPTTHQLTRWSCAGIVLFAITLTFAAIDWIM
ncbi:MAG: hypothetical protein HYY61_06635, partial [Deltaproteobacteria bacterium]|nr:hypothetical protein [Deltaproteobacteria bacterium]